MDGVVDEVPSVRASPGPARTESILVLLNLAPRVSVCVPLHTISMIHGISDHLLGSAVRDITVTDDRSDVEDNGEDGADEKDE